MTAHILMTIVNIICIMVCTDGMRAAWDNQLGGFFVLSSFGVFLSAAALLFSCGCLLSPASS